MSVENKIHVISEDNSLEEHVYKAAFTFSSYGVIVLLLENESTLLLYPQIEAYQKGSVPKEEIKEKIMVTEPGEHFAPINTPYRKMAPSEMGLFSSNVWVPLN